MMTHVMTWQKINLVFIDVRCYFQIIIKSAPDTNLQNFIYKLALVLGILKVKVILPVKKRSPRNVGRLINMGTDQEPYAYVAAGSGFV